MILWATRGWLGYHKFFTKLPKPHFDDKGELIYWEGEEFMEEYVYGFEKLFPLVGLSRESVVKIEIVEEDGGYKIRKVV